MRSLTSYGLYKKQRDVTKIHFVKQSHMSKGKVNKILRNMAIATVNEGIAKGYFGAEQGQNAATPKRSDGFYYDFTAMGVTFNALVQHTGFEGQELHFLVFIAPVPPGSKINAYGSFGFYIWRANGKFDICTPVLEWVRGNREMVATLKETLSNGVIEPIGYTPRWSGAFISGRCPRPIHWS
jgi:hypothetical protein